MLRRHVLLVHEGLKMPGSMREQAQIFGEAALQLDVGGQTAGIEYSLGIGLETFADNALFLMWLLAPSSHKRASRPL